MTPFDPRLQVIATQARVKTCHVFHCWQAMREMGASFHIEAFAHFAGLEPKHVQAILSALRDNNAMPGAKREASPRGSRLPLDWKLPDEWKQYAIEQRKWQPEDVDKEAAAFADYWQSKAGQSAVKLDWRKTWQNWIRNSHRPDGTYVPSTNRTPQDWLTHCRERLAWAKETGYREGVQMWSENLRTAEAKAASNVVPINRVAG